MKTYKLVIPSLEDLPRKLCLSLAGLDNTEVEIRFLSAANQRVVNTDLNPDEETTFGRTNDTTDRRDELLSQLDIDSSGGFIPPEIAEQLQSDDDFEEVVESSQSEDHENVVSVIPGLFSSRGLSDSDRDMSSSSDDECFVPATQQEIVEKARREENILEEVANSDEESGWEDGDRSLSAQKSKENSQSKVGSSKMPDESSDFKSRNQKAVEEVLSDSDESFAGEPIADFSQPVAPLEKKKFVKKRNCVILSSDDEEEETVAEKVRRSLPDLESEPFFEKPNEKEDENEDFQENSKRETLERLKDTSERRCQESLREGSIDIEDPEEEILSGFQERLVEETPVQESPKKRSSGSNLSSESEQEEVPETEEQRERQTQTTVQVDEFKKPLPVTRKNISNVQTPASQQSLKLLLLSDSENTGVSCPPEPHQTKDDDHEASQPPKPNSKNDDEEIFQEKDREGNGNSVSETEKTAEKDDNSFSHSKENETDVFNENEESRNIGEGGDGGEKDENREEVPKGSEGVDRKQGNGSETNRRVTRSKARRPSEESDSKKLRNSENQVFASSDSRFSSSPSSGETNSEVLRAEVPLHAENCPFRIAFGRSENYRDDFQTNVFSNNGPAEGNPNLAILHCPPNEYAFLRTLQRRNELFDDESRKKVVKWLEANFPNDNKDDGFEKEEEFASLVGNDEVARPLSPIISIPDELEGAEGATPRKRSFPGPCVKSPEKRPCTNPEVKSNTDDVAVRAKAPSTAGFFVCPAAEIAGDHAETPQVGGENVENQSAQSNYKPARITRRRRLYNSQEEASQQKIEKLVDSQEVEKPKYPKALPSPVSSRKISLRGTKQGASSVNSRIEGTPSRRTRANRSDGDDKTLKSDSKASASGQKPTNSSKFAEGLDKPSDLAEAQVPTPTERTAKISVEVETPDEVLVPESVADEKTLSKSEQPSNEIEETPSDATAQIFSRPTRTLRRSSRSRGNQGSESSKSELPDPYAKETIEVEPTSIRSTRSSSRKSQSKGNTANSLTEFSEEINPELVASHRIQEVLPTRPTRVRSFSKQNERDQSTPKRSRLIKKSSSSSISLRLSSENNQISNNRDPNSSINDSLASSESSIGVNRMAKARVMFTGIDNPPHEEVLKLGLKLTDIISQCNVVVAAKFTRTVKMMYAMAKGIPVVSSKWITASLKANKVLGYDNFMLVDEVAEKKYNFKLEATLRLASETKFFKGWSFYVTKSCSPSAEQLGEMLSGCDAKVISKVPSKFAENTVIVTCANDRKLLPKKPSVPLVSVEFVFHGILRHQIDFESFQIN